MTVKLNIGNRRFFWPLDDMDLTFTEISATMRDIARNFRMLDTKCKFVFMPDPGLDLIRLNKIPHPVPWRELIVQEELEEHLILLHLYTRVLNSYMGSLTPWTLDISHSHRNGNLHPVYDRMHDGLHFSGSQVIKLASEINRYARSILIENGNGFEVSITILLINTKRLLFSCILIASSGYLVLISYSMNVAADYRFRRLTISSVRPINKMYPVSKLIYWIHFLPLINIKIVSITSEYWTTYMLTSSDYVTTLTKVLITNLLLCRTMISSGHHVVQSDQPSPSRLMITILRKTSGGYQCIQPVVLKPVRLLDIDLSYCRNALNLIIVYLFLFISLLIVSVLNSILCGYIVVRTHHTDLIIMLSRSKIQCLSSNLNRRVTVIFKLCLRE